MGPCAERVFRPWLGLASIFPLGAVGPPDDDERSQRAGYDQQANPQKVLRGLFASEGEREAAEEQDAEGYQPDGNDRDCSHNFASYLATHLR